MRFLLRLKALVVKSNVEVEIQPQAMTPQARADALSEYQEAGDDLL